MKFCTWWKNPDLDRFQFLTNDHKTKPTIGMTRLFLSFFHNRTLERKKEF